MTINIERELLEQALESMCWAARTLNIAQDEAPNYHRSLENIRAALAAPAPDDRHAQELLAQDITLQNMAERHAQELCAYEVTVGKLRAELEAAQKDAATDHHLVNGLRDFYLGYLSQYLPLDAFERVRRTTVTAAAVRILRNVRAEHAAIAAQEKS